MGLFLTPGAFDSVQDFVALVDSGSNLLFASKTRSVRKIADDAPILEMQFRREIKLGRHNLETSNNPGGSEHAERFPERTVLTRFITPENASDSGEKAIPVGISRLCVGEGAE
jgi:hypothetical protein